jgi:hypothetical protein
MLNARLAHGFDGPRGVTRDIPDQGVKLRHNQR